MKKTLTMVLAFALVFALGVGGTLAWLKDTTPEVKNTFSPSTINIDLTETVPANQTAKMVPGATIDKNPTVVVEANSENCYLFIEVTETGDVDTFLNYTIDSAWQLVPGETNVYYLGTADALTKVMLNETTAQNFPILTNNQVAVDENVTKAQMDALKDDLGLTFKAYAVQAENLKVTAIADIWNLAKAQ